MSAKGKGKGTGKGKKRKRNQTNSTPGSNKKCTNPSWEIVQTQPGVNMENVFRSILSNVDVAEVYGCLKLLHNMHTSFGEIILNRGIISSFSGMIDIALINNLNLLKYLKNNNRQTIEDIKNLLFDSNGNGLIGYYTESPDSAPVLCQIVNPERQAQYIEELNNAKASGTIRELLQSFIDTRNEQLISANNNFQELARMVSEYETAFENWIKVTSREIRKLTKRRIETERKTRLTTLRTALSDLGWNKKVALPKYYEITDTDIQNIEDNIGRVLPWSDDPPEQKDPEFDLADYIFSAKSDERRLYPIQAVKLTKNRLDMYLNSELIQIDNPEQFILLPNYLQENVEILSRYIYTFNKAGFSFDVPIGYFGIFGAHAPVIDNIVENESKEVEKKDVTSTVQWRGFWQSIMRHNYKPLGSQDAQKNIESALYFNPKTSTRYNRDWLTNSTPFCTIANKERLICGICGRPVGETKWAEASTGGKGYDVDHVANLIFNELLGLNARSDGLGFLNTCAKCNQAFKSEKIWSPSLELWNVLNEICENKGYITDYYPWPGQRNTGLIDEIPFGGVRVYTIVNTHNKALEREWQYSGKDIREVRKGEGYYSPSARHTKTAEMEPHELELVILDRYLKIAQTSEGQYMINVENGFIKKYTEKVSIIASGARYIEYQTTLTQLLQEKISKSQRRYDEQQSQEAYDEMLARGEPIGPATRMPAGLDSKSDQRYQEQQAINMQQRAELGRRQPDARDVVADNTQATMRRLGDIAPFDEDVVNMSRSARMNFYEKIYNAWRDMTKPGQRYTAQEKAFLHNRIAELHFNQMDTSNLLLLIEDLKELLRYSPQSPPREGLNPSPGKADRARANESRAMIIEKHILPILNSIIMFKAMNKSSLFPGRHLLHNATERTRPYKMNVLTGEISAYNNNDKNVIIDKKLLDNKQNKDKYKRTAKERKRFKLERQKKQEARARGVPVGQGSIRQYVQGRDDGGSASASSSAYNAGDVDVLEEGSILKREPGDDDILPPISEVLSAPGNKSPEPTDQDSDAVSGVGDGFRTPTKPQKRRRYRRGGGKSKTFKIRRRKKNTRRNRKNKNNKTKLKKRYKLKLTRRNK